MWLSHLYSDYNIKKTKVNRIYKNNEVFLMANVSNDFGTVKNLRVWMNALRSKEVTINGKKAKFYLYCAHTKMSYFQKRYCYMVFGKIITILINAVWMYIYAIYEII